MTEAHLKATAVLVIAGFMYLFTAFILRVLRAPEPASMPPVVPESMDSLPRELETE